MSGNVWRRCNGFINFATWSCEPNRSTAKPRGPVRFGRGVKTEILVTLTSSTQPSHPISEFTRRKRFSFYSFLLFFHVHLSLPYLILLSHANSRFFSLFFSLGFFLFCLSYPLSDYLFCFTLSSAFIPLYVSF